MVNIVDFRDFEAFKACRAFVRLGRAIDSIGADKKRSVFKGSNATGLNFGPFEFRGGL